MRSAGILRYVAAQCTSALRRRVRSVVQAERLRCLRQSGIDHPRLQPRESVLGIDLEDLVHARRAHDNPVLRRERTPGQPCARATWHHLDTRPMQYLNNPGYFIGRRRQYDRARHDPVGGEPIGLIDEQAIRVGDDVLLADNFSQLEHERPGNRRHARLEGHGRGDL
ncbi:uncharacterized protein METZ01_LOCUS393004, partial [marine metagenome]